MNLFWVGFAIGSASTIVYLAVILVILARQVTPKDQPRPSIITETGEHVPTTWEIATPSQATRTAEIR